MVVGLGKLSGAGFRIAILHIHIINMRVFFQVSQLPRLLIWFQDGLHLLPGKGAFFGVDFLQDQDKVGVNGFGLRLRLHCMHFQNSFQRFTFFLMLCARGKGTLFAG